LIDAILYAARDAVRAGLGYDYATCDITEDGRPPPRAGAWFVAIHGGNSRPGTANSRNLDELYGFSATLTGRIVIPLDRVGEQLIARNVDRALAAAKNGFNIRLEQLRNLLHSNWSMVVLQGQTPASANDNLIAWGSGTGVYGFVEPCRIEGGLPAPTMVGTADWMGDDPESEEFCLKSELRFGGARRFQPQTASVGAFV
jgi:hypothetical protein